MAPSKDDNEEEDDYMNMIITEPTKPREKETYTQRRIRKEREVNTSRVFVIAFIFPIQHLSYAKQAELKRPKSKAELEQLAAEARETALARPLHETEPSSKGLKMMQAMGFQAGGVLGKQQDENLARKEPLELQIKENRGGVGLDAEKKRKIREEFVEESKRQKVEELDFRERVRLEREERRLEGQVLGAQKVAERLDGDEDGGVDNAGRSRSAENGHDNDEKTAERSEAGDTSPKRASKVDARPLKKINVFWRGLVRHRLEKEQERRRRYDLQQSLSRLPTYDDPDEDRDDRRALSRDIDEKRNVLVEDELELEEDLELDEFNALPPAERLQKLVDYLRSEHHYCFWCKYRYPDDSMDGCPGVTEEDHD